MRRRCRSPCLRRFRAREVGAPRASGVPAPLGTSGTAGTVAAGAVGTKPAPTGLAAPHPSPGTAPAGAHAHCATRPPAGAHAQSIDQGATGPRGNPRRSGPRRCRMLRLLRWRRCCPLRSPRSSGAQVAVPSQACSAAAALPWLLCWAPSPWHPRQPAYSGSQSEGPRTSRPLYLRVSHRQLRRTDHPPTCGTRSRLGRRGARLIRRRAGGQGLVWRRCCSLLAERQPAGAPWGACLLPQRPCGLRTRCGTTPACALYLICVYYIGLVSSSKLVHM